jgi:hypothetical protein
MLSLHLVRMLMACKEVSALEESSVENVHLYNIRDICKHVPSVGIFCELRSQKVFGNFSFCI